MTFTPEDLKRLIEDAPLSYEASYRLQHFSLDLAKQLLAAMERLEKADALIDMILASVEFQDAAFDGALAAVGEKGGAP